MTILLLAGGCVSAGKTGQQAEQSQRVYWKVYPKSDSTFYILPRPELTADLPTPESMNNLSESQARRMAAGLNNALQFQVHTDKRTSAVEIRVVPEPAVEDIIEICRAENVHSLVKPRCAKELDWAARGKRPDIYLAYGECEAFIIANLLNRLYQRPELDDRQCSQVEK